MGPTLGLHNGARVTSVWVRWGMRTSTGRPNGSPTATQRTSPGRRKEIPGDVLWTLCVYFVATAEVASGAPEAFVPAQARIGGVARFHVAMA